MSAIPTISHIVITTRQMESYEGGVAQMRDELVVTPYWTGVDRPQGNGYAMYDTPSKRRLAERLKACMLSGKMYPNPHVLVNVNGKTYAAWDGYLVSGRSMSADLKRLGF